MSGESTQLSLIFFYGTAFAIIFVVSLVVFMLHYQNKMLRHQDELKKIEEEKKEQMMKALLQGQENEQRRVAMELHDGIGMEMAAMKLHLYPLKKVLNDSGLSLAHYEKVLGLMDATFNNVRRISHRMLPEYITKNGLLHSLGEVINDLNASGNLTATLQTEGTYVPGDAERELMIYRVVQELCQNVVKHAEATALTVKIKTEETRLTITVTDNGKGFEQQPGKLTGVGLQNIEARVNVLKGTFSVTSQLSKGTEAVITL